MFSAVSESTLDLDMLDRHGHQPIKYKRVNEETGREVQWKDIVKGFKKDGKYVVLEDKDFEKAAPEKTKKIAIMAFVSENEIDPIYFDGSYFLAPEKGTPHPYILLRRALSKTGMVGLGSYVLRNREHLCIIRVYQNIIALSRIYYEQEIRDPEELNIPAKNAKINAEEVAMAVSLVKTLAKPFDISAYKDEYTAALKKLISRKAKGKTVSEPKSKPLPKEVSSLMEQLKASLRSPKTPKTKTATRKKNATAKKPAKRSRTRRNA
jgi:DNA end-binding protein Ku